MFLLALSATACGEDAPSGSQPGPFVTELACPLPGTLPFGLPDIEWRSSASESASESQPRLKHQAADVLGNPAVGFVYTDQPGDAVLESGNLFVRGEMARTDANRGLFAEEVIGELVSVWELRNEEEWVTLGEATTSGFESAQPGRFEIDTGVGLSTTDEVQTRYAVLDAEPSCVPQLSFALSGGRQVVVADIDGTLTLSDDELLEQVGDIEYDPKQKTAAADVMNAWADKGYQVVYLTARPHLFRTETRAWLDAHGYPPGPVISATDLVFGDAAAAYKTAWVTRIAGELGWDIVAAYGNATSDIDAYEAASVPKSVTFIIGPNAGMAGTVAIANDDYTDHLQYVAAQPDAN